MGNLVGKLIIDEWFKMITFAGFVLTILALTVELRIDNIIIAGIGAALMCVGIAEMAMRPYAQKIALDSLNRPQYSISGRMRRVNAPGIAFYLLAIACATGVAARAFVLFGQA